MKRPSPKYSTWSGLMLAIAVPMWLLSAPAGAQDRPGPSGGGGGDRGGGAAAGGGGGATASGGGSSSGGSVSSGGGGGGGTESRASGGGSNAGGGVRGNGEGHYGATGSTGYAAPRGGDHGDRGARTSSGSASGSPRGSSGSGSNGGGSNGTARVGTGAGERGRATLRGSEGGTNNAASGKPEGVPPYARPRGDNQPVGTAVPRGAVPTNGAIGRGTGVIIPGYDGYYGGGYYGAYYDPWWLGYSGGYYGGYYDPWYGGYPDLYPMGGYGGGGSTYTSTDEGSLRLKIKPRQAEVYVDGFFVGIVDDFDGIFQRLHLDSGPHRVEVRAQGYETLTFEVRVTADHTTTYQGELKKIQ